MNTSIFYDLARFQKITDTAREKIKQSLDIPIIEKLESIILDDLDPDRIKTFGWNH
jgi:hypothetical protein